MSSHGSIKKVGIINFSPEFVDGEILFEINMPEFVWAKSKDEALNYLDDTIQSAKRAKKAIVDAYGKGEDIPYAKKSSVKRKLRE